MTTDSASKQAANEAVYDQVWESLPLYPHSDFSLWPDIEKELHGGRCLELGAGVLPRSPVSGGYFVDLSRVALRKLAAHGGHCVRAAGQLPFRDGAFTAVCAFEVLEHIPDDEAMIAEIARVLTPGGALIFSVPVNPQLYTHFDAVCEHVRRYDAGALQSLLGSHGLRIERWATQPNHFGKVAGWLAGASLRAALHMPRLLRWLKRSSVENAMHRTFSWRTDDIRASHADGGLLAVARRSAQ